MLFIAALLSVNSPTELIGRSADFTGRADVWRVTESLISRRQLLGYGLGFWSFDSRDKFNAWDQLGWAAPHAHNDILDVTLQTGMLGLSFYLYNWIIALIRGFGVVRRKNLEGSFFFLLFFSICFRTFSEVVSVFPGINTIALIVLCQLKINKAWLQTKVRGGNKIARNIPKRLGANLAVPVGTDPAAAQPAS